MSPNPSPDGTPDPVVVTVELEPVQALALAQFAKRLGWTEARTCAVDDDEARQIIDAVYRLQDGLDAAGYAPR